MRHEYRREGRVPLDHLKREYPEHKREPLMGKRPRKARRSAPVWRHSPSAPGQETTSRVRERFYDHGAKDFSGYVKSFTQAYHGALTRRFTTSLTDEATKWREGTAQPPQIEYRGKTYYSPDVAKSMRAGASRRTAPRQILEYRAYDPAKDDKMMIRDFENSWSTSTTAGRESAPATAIWHRKTWWTPSNTTT